MTVRVQAATDDDLPTIVSWLEEPEIAKWLDFGVGHVVTAAALKLDIARGTERIFMFSPEEKDTPVGVISLSHIRPVLEIAFGEVGLGCDQRLDRRREPALGAVPGKSRLRLIGRQRRCHYIGDRPCDRHLFDRLSNRFDGTDG